MEDIEAVLFLLSCQFGACILLLVWLLDRIEKRIDRIIANLEATQQARAVDCQPSEKSESV